MMETTNYTRILIVEDDALIAEDIKDICELEGYKVPSVCYNYHQSIVAIQNNVFDIALLDINLENEKSGLDVAEFIRNMLHPIPILFLTSYSDKTYLQAAKKYQPVGYITKPFQEEQLISGIEIGLNNHPQLSNSNIRIKGKSKIMSLLTAREYQIALLICEGKSNDEIASIVFLSVNTIKFHIKHIYEKLDIGSRTQLMLLFTNQD